jgi:2-polyprenyl-3-methyl-5-hydroxy-6-metoxy-1,4-benzoquinol methylase
MLSRFRQMWQQRSNREALYSTAAYWDSKAETLKGKAVSMWPNNHLNVQYQAELEAVIGRHLGSVAGLRVLDVGCGTGRMSRWFAERGARVDGIDFSASALSIAKAESPPGNPSYRLGSIFELTDEQVYDVAFAWGVITFACRTKEELLDALVRIRRALKDGGRLLLTEPVHQGFLHRVLAMDLPMFLAVMRNAGFDVRATAPMHFWPARLLLSYVQWPAWLTAPAYWIGQGAMRLPGLSRLGDYWAILATPAVAAHPS